MTIRNISLGIVFTKISEINPTNVWTANEHQGAVLIIVCIYCSCLNNRRYVPKLKIKSLVKALPKMKVVISNQKSIFIFPHQYTCKCKVVFLLELNFSSWLVDFVLYSVRQVLSLASFESLGVVIIDFFIWLVDSVTVLPSERLRVPEVEVVPSACFCFSKKIQQREANTCKHVHRMISLFTSNNPDEN